MAKVGRPKIEIDWKKVESLCAIHCTAEEIASILDISSDTLERRCKENHNISLAEYIRQKSANGKASLRRRQYKKAMEEGNTTMLIWLGKQWLGQTDRMEHVGDDTKPLTLNYKLKDNET